MKGISLLKITNIVSLGAALIGLMVAHSAEAQKAYVSSFGSFSDGSGGVVKQYNVTGVFQRDFAAVNSAHDIVFDGLGDVYVGSFFAGTVTRFAPDGSGASIFAGPGTYRGATGLVFDSSGRLYVSDQATGNIYRYDANGHNQTIFASGIASPNHMKIHGGNLYVTSQVAGTVLEYALDGRFLRTVVSGVPGIVGLDFDAAGALYVSSNFNGFIRRYAPGSASGVDIVTGLVNPHGVTIGPDQMLYVAEELQNRILEFNLDGSGERTFISVSHPVEIEFMGATPEPGMWALLCGLGITGAGISRSRRKR